MNYQSHPSNCFLYSFPGISNSWEHGREYDVYSKIATFLPIYKQLYTYVYLFTAWYRAMGMIHAQSKYIFFSSGSSAMGQDVCPQHCIIG